MTTYHVEGGTLRPIHRTTSTPTPTSGTRKFGDEWADFPGSNGIGADVMWSGDYYPIPEEQVPEFQERCRRGFAEHQARVEANEAAEANRD